LPRPLHDGPESAGRWRNRQIANLNTPELGPKVSELRISDDELRESIEATSCA
jgi:4-oxalmesaconate hydratase